MSNDRAKRIAAALTDGQAAQLRAVQEWGPGIIGTRLCPTRVADALARRGLLTLGDGTTHRERYFGAKLTPAGRALASRMAAKPTPEEE